MGQTKLAINLAINLTISSPMALLIPAVIWRMAGISFSNRNAIHVSEIVRWSWKAGVEGMILSWATGVILGIGFISFISIFISLPIKTVVIIGMGILFWGWIGQSIFFFYSKKIRTLSRWFVAGTIIWVFCVVTLGKSFILLIAIPAISGVLGLLLVGPAFMVIFGLTRREAVAEEIVPNQGIRRAGRNAVFWGMLITGGWIVLAIVVRLCSYYLSIDLVKDFLSEYSGGYGGLFGEMPRFYKLEMPQEFHEWITFSVGTGKIELALFGLPIGLFAGGAACIQHFTLRLLLSSKGYLPWRLVRFLDYAAERIFLRKIGGGYIFVHRMLMEYFASLENYRDFT